MIWQKIRSLFNTITKNLDAAIVGGVAVAVVIIDIVGEVDLSLHLSVITASLAILLFRSMRSTKPTVDVDAVLQDRDDFEPFPEFIKGARSLWVYAPSGINLMSQLPKIKEEILDHGGEVRFIIQDPSKPESVRFLSQQLDKDSDLSADITHAISRLKNLSSKNSHAHYRLLDHSPGVSLVIINAHKPDGRMIVETLGYNSDTIIHRMHVKITRQSSQHWFEYWSQQYENMWNDAVEPSTSEA